MKKLTILSITFVLTTVLFSQEHPRRRTTIAGACRKAPLLRLGKGNVLDVAWSPDGTRLAVGGSAGIWLYDAQTGAEVSLITGHSFRVNAVAFFTRRS